MSAAKIAGDDESERGGAGAVSANLDRRGATEWLVVFGVGLAGVALAAVAVLTPWQAGGLQLRQDHGERVIRVHVPVTDVLSVGRSDPR
jgi:hypothetical protein